MHINAATRVIYPRTFRKDKREIFVDGEVYLDVAHRENQPFIVQTDKFNIEVKGTAFDVNAYSDESRSAVVLLRGKVLIHDSHNDQILMQPDELVAVDDGRIVDKKQVDASEYIAWTQSLIILHGDPLEEVCRKLQRFYGVPVRADASCAETLIYGKLDVSTPLTEVLRRISVATPLHYQEQNGVIELRR
jgi:ferric-dicitrate binding protein FerR (iron transport regulator)